MTTGGYRLEYYTCQLAYCQFIGRRYQNGLKENFYQKKEPEHCCWGSLSRPIAGNEL